MTDRERSLSSAQLSDWKLEEPGPPDRSARKVIVVSVCLTVFVLSAFFDLMNDFAGIGILTVALLVGLPEANRSSLAATLVATGVAIFTMPYIGLIYVGEPVETAWFALFVVVAIVHVAYGELHGRSSASIGHGVADLPLIVAYLALGLLFWAGDGLLQVSFYAGWALALIHLERVHVATPSLPYRGAGLFVFAVVIGYFTTVLWSGGGRIVQLSFALGPILLAAHYGTIRLNTWSIGAAAAGLSFAGRLLRFGWSDGLAGLAVDSGASPITITSYLWDTQDVVLISGSIVGQWLLLFLNWFPRELWPNKPIGIGSEFVDLVTGRQGFSAGHSFATGYFGEHMFFLPHAWFLSVALLVVVVIVLRRLMVRVSAPYRAPVVAFDVWLITLFWGGMASFAARVWFVLIPVIPYVLAIKWLDARRGRATRPATPVPAV